MAEAKKNIVELFNETKENLRPVAPKFRSGKVFEGGLHAKTFKALLFDADKKMTLDLIEGISNGVFAKNQQQRAVECNILEDVILDNIHDEDVVSKSFGAMKNMLNSAAISAKYEDKKAAVDEVTAMQNMLDAISELYDYYPKALGKQTDMIYEEYKKMMKEYSLRGLHKETSVYSSETIDDYFHNRDEYILTKEAKVIHNQENMAWETKDQLEAAKQRIYDKFTKREVADYEQRRAKQAESEDAQYTAELREFVREHGNSALRKKRHSQMDEAWSQKERGERAQKDFDKAITDRLITDYEKEHAAQIKKEDTQYRAELKGFIGNYDNRKLSEKHQEQITEIKLKHSDLNKIYNDYKDVARKPEDGETAKEIPISGKKNKISKRAVFLARVENKRQA